MEGVQYESVKKQLDGAGYDQELKNMGYSITVDRMPDQKQLRTVQRWALPQSLHPPDGPAERRLSDDDDLLWS